MDELLPTILENAPTVVTLIYLFWRVDSRSQTMTDEVVKMADRISAMNERILSDCIDQGQ